MFLQKRMIGLAMCSMLGVGYVASRADAAVPRNAPSTVLELKQGWSVQSDCKVQGDGPTFSKAEFHPAGWYSATVPATVLAVQVAAGEFKDPYFGMNLRSIPGTTYPIGKNFSNIEMAADSPYACGWWYRKSFRIPVSERGKVLWL
ncbi:MAG: hypothetical protein ABI158_04640, partial [Edaphobacter sp.]